MRYKRTVDIRIQNLFVKLKYQTNLIQIFNCGPVLQE